MKTMFALSMILGLSLSLTAASEVKECPNFSEEKMAELKKLVITDDVHEKFLGDFTEVWGPKPAIEADENTCIKTSRQKINDTHLSQSVYIKGEWFGGEKTKNCTLEKVENGVYLMRKQSGELKAKVFLLYAQNNVYSVFACKMSTGHGPADETKKPEGKKHDDKKKNKLPFWSTVSIRAEDLKTPLEEDVQKYVKEAVAKIQEHKELLGEVVEYPHPC